MSALGNAPPAPGRAHRAARLASVEPEPSTVGRTLAAALAGDRDAWERIVEDYSRLLWWVARGHRLDDATAADVVQTVWLQLLRFGHRIDDPERLPAWLATVARREALRRVSGHEIPDAELADRSDQTTPSPEERIVDEETIGVVMAAFARLSPDDQRLLRLLCDVPPRSYDEIAALLGRTTGYVGPTRRRALDRLRALIREMGMS
jgi:RNA polymerase sigma factor (sigma-70 family)